MGFCREVLNLYLVIDLAGIDNGRAFLQILMQLHTNIYHYTALTLIIYFSKTLYTKCATNFWAWQKNEPNEFSKNANIYKYFEPAFVILQACFGSSTSPNSAKKAVKIKSAKSSYMCHRATQICAKDAPGVRIDTGKLGQQLSYLFVPSKAVSVSVSVSLFFFLSSTPYVRTAPTSASTSAHGSFEGSSFWAQKNTQK